MSDNLLTWLNNAYYLHVVALSLIPLFRWAKLSSLQKRIAHVVIIAVLNDHVSKVLVEYDATSWLAHFYLPIFYVFVVRVYAKVLSSLFGKHFFNVLQVGFVLFSVINSVFLQRTAPLISNAIVLGYVTFIFLSLSYFYQLIKVSDHQVLERNPMAWFNTGALLYFSGALLLFMFISDVIATTLPVRNYALGINSVLNMILMIFYAIALCVNPKK